MITTLITAPGTQRLRVSTLYSSCDGCLGVSISLDTHSNLRIGATSTFRRFKKNPLTPLPPAHCGKSRSCYRYSPLTFTHLTRAHRKQLSCPRPTFFCKINSEEKKTGGSRPYRSARLLFLKKHDDFTDAESSNKELLKNNGTTATNTHSKEAIRAKKSLYYCILLLHIFRARPRL